MAKIILIQMDDIEAQYLESMRYLNGKYHDHPTHLRDIPPTAEEARWLAMHGQQNCQIPAGYAGPLGKLVV